MKKKKEGERRMRIRMFPLTFTYVPTNLCIFENFMKFVFQLYNITTYVLYM